MRISELLKSLFASRKRPRRFDPRARAPDCQAAPDDEEDIDPFNPFPEPVRLEITDTFDLHSIPPREVRAVVEEYLEQARRAGFRQVRIIHGKGVGVRREVVRGVLSKTPFVEHFADAPPEAGGWGATVAEMREGKGTKGSE